MLTPYTGNAAYCFSHSLHMCLRQAGMTNLPEVSFFECLTGMPFGAMMLTSPEPMFFPSPPWADPDAGLTLALESLGWACETWRGESRQEALDELHTALRFGPVLLGPLRMDHLSYDASHKNKTDADHFIVVLEVDDRCARVHDPQGFPFAVLPPEDLMASWNASGIFYAVAPYTLRHAFRQQHAVSREEAIRRTLGFIQENADWTFNGPPMIGGIKAYQLMVEAVRSGTGTAFTDVFTHFALPLGARRCTDAGSFLYEAREAEAANLMLEKAKLYGEAQRHAVYGELPKVAACLERLSSVEQQFVAAVLDAKL